MIGITDLGLIVLMNLVSDGIFVLFLAPRVIARMTSSRTAKEAAQRIKQEVLQDVPFIESTMELAMPRVKGSILNDPEFMVTFQSDLLSDDFIDQFMGKIVSSPSTADGLEHFREIIMGQVLGFKNAEEHGMAVKALQKDFMKDLESSNPELATILELFPSVKARIQKSPALLPTALNIIKKVLGAVQQ